MAYELFLCAVEFFLKLPIIFLGIIKIIKNVRSGFMLLDALLGAGVFAIFLSAVGITILAGQIGFLRSGDRAQAVFFAEQSLEAVRTMRDADWESLVIGGPYGLGIDENGLWEFSGTGTAVLDGFTSSVNIFLINNDELRVESNIVWNLGGSRSGEITLNTILTNWRKVNEIGDWTNVTEQAVYLDGGLPLFTDIQANESYVFITSEISQGGAGLYLFDISNLSSPQRIVSGFSMSDDVHSAILVGTGLFLATNSINSEIQIYDVSSPETFSAGDMIGSINIPGEGRGRALALFNDTLFVGSKESATEDELFSYNVSNLSSPVFLDSFNTEGGLNKVILKDGYAFFASTEDVAELRIIDVFNPSDLQNAPGNGYNLTDDVDAQAIAATGTGIFIGRANGLNTEEIIFFDITSSPVPSPPPGPYYKEISAGINDLDVEPGGRYVFLASDFALKELQILIPDLLVSGQPAQATSKDLNAAGEATFYSQALDRLFFVTRNSFHIFRPN